MTRLSLKGRNFGLGFVSCLGNRNDIFFGFFENGSAEKHRKRIIIRIVWRIRSWSSWLSWSWYGHRGFFGRWIVLVL